MPDGSIKHARVTARPFWDGSGDPEFVRGVTDISIEETFRLIVETIPGLIAVMTAGGEVAHVNRQVLDYFGRTLEELKKWGTTDAVHPVDLPGVVVAWQHAVETGLPYEVEHRLRRADGEYRWFVSRGLPLRDDSGHIVRWYNLLTDIHVRKQSEESLQHSEAVLQKAFDGIKKSEAKLRQVIDAIPTLAWCNLPDGPNEFLNKRWHDYTGLPLESSHGWGWQVAFHPEDLPSLMEKWRELLISGEPGEIEARLRRFDGVYRWFLISVEPLHDEAGRIVRWYGTSTDVEDRKQAEDRLRQENIALKRAEEKIREQETEWRQILDFVPQLVRVFGPDHERIYANRIGLDYLGVSLEEWRQIQDMCRFVHPDDGDRMRAFFDRARSIGAACELEVRLRKGDGSYRWFLVRYNPVCDNKGQIIRWYVAGTDIEDRKQAEDRLRHENVALREEVDKTSMFEEIVGTSPALKTVLSHISKVAPSNLTVLISGETGTGKELVARAIHRRSDRVSRPFVGVNCAAIPRDLIASELFGHEKGAFTGATQQRLGRFELANGGSIFLDEVGELPSETQIALLRVLQEHEFERVGGNRRIRADVRVIAATNRDLQAAISAGSFRSDLFYRLNVFPIEIPSLRERKEDIPLLVEYFIDRYARKAKKNIRGVNKKTLELLQSYRWPGNIRELQNVIERLVIVCETENFSIDENWLPQQPLLTAEPKPQVELSHRLLVQEKDMIEAALKETRGRVSGPAGAAVKLGIPRSTLESKIRSLKIDKNRFRT
jgi:formate hydrogenlyase transcriptional activator